MNGNINTQTANVVSIFDQYRSKSQVSKSATPENASSNPRAYKAYEIDTPQKRTSLMAIYYGNGAIGLMQKSHLIEMLLTSSRNLSMVFTSCIITLEGSNLDQLVELFQDEKILSLHCFSPKLHDTPEVSEIFISNIIRRNPGDISAGQKKQE